MAIPILSSIGNFFKNAFSSNSIQQTKIWGVGNKEVYAPIEQETALSRGFNANTAVYSIVKKYAKKAASIAKYVEDKSTDEPLKDTHPLVMLLNRPNERQSRQVFFKLVFGGYKLFGEAFIWLNRGDIEQMVNEFGELVDRPIEERKKKPVLEMYTIPANQIVVIPDPYDPFKVIGYQLRNRPQIKFRKEEMIQWQDINLDWDEFGRPQIRGMTPLKPGYKTLTADNSLIDSMVRMSQNDGSKAIAYNESLVQPTPKQQTQIEDVFSDKINNKDRKNSVAALQGKWGLLNLGLTAVDMDTLKARSFIYKEFCFLFGVPYTFFDTETKYDNQSEIIKQWVVNEIKPDCDELDGELNRELLPSFGLTLDTAEICSDIDKLPEMQEDLVKKSVYLMNSPITPNEFREEMGWQPIKNNPVMEEVRMSGSSSSIEVDPNMPQDPNADPNNAANAYP